MLQNQLATGIDLPEEKKNALQLLTPETATILFPGSQSLANRLSGATVSRKSDQHLVR